MTLLPFWHWLVSVGFLRDVVADLTAFVLALSVAFWKRAPFFRPIVKRLEKIEEKLDDKNDAGD